MTQRHYGGTYGSKKHEHNRIKNRRSNDEKIGCHHIYFYDFNQYTFTTMAAQNATLYAKWTINQYTISFDSNDGSSVIAITQDYNTIVTAPSAPTRTGYSFAGWYSDAGLTSAYTFTSMPAEDTTLYAKWIINQYTISFNSNGGTSVTAITQDYNTSVSAPTAPTRTGYTFAGWYSDAGQIGRASCRGRV